jgi:hypothetical protein
MRFAGLPVAACVFAAMAAGASADSDADKGIEFRPYFGAAYERGWLEFKSTTLYGKEVTGYAPIIGVTMGKYFALEGSVRRAYGDGETVNATLPDVLTDTTKISTKTVTAYHTSSSAFAFDLLVRYPLGNTGLAPFFLTGISIDKLKEVTKTDSTVTSHLRSATDTSKDVITTATEYAVLQGKTEVSPEIGFGLSYSYGGAELRVLGRLQNLNMGNTGKYFLTASAGLVMKL